MSQNLGSLPPLSHNVTFRRPPTPPLTRDVINGWSLKEGGGGQQRVTRGAGILNFVTSHFKNSIKAILHVSTKLL